MTRRRSLAVVLRDGIPPVCVVRVDRYARSPKYEVAVFRRDRPVHRLWSGDDVSEAFTRAEQFLCEVKVAMYNAARVRINDLLA